jgi:hypothetical protein
VMWLRWSGRAWSGVPTPEGRERFGVRAGTWVIAFAVVMVVFTVVRNLPMGSWLAP